MKNSNPEISIIMGVYNAENRVTKAIESIISQTFKSWELIICDDGSKDNTMNIIKKLQEKEPRIILIRNKKNMGLAYSLNHCISIANGRYIARMDDDDWSLPNRLEIEHNFLLNNPEYAIVGCNANIVDRNGIWGELIRKETPNKLDIWSGNSFIHPSVLMDKEALIASGCYTTAKYVGRTEDFDLWCKFYFAGYKGYNLQIKLLNYYEDKQVRMKRKYIYRIKSTKLRLLWRKSLNIKVKYLSIAFKPMLHGLVPLSIIQAYKSIKKKS